MRARTRFPADTSFVVAAFVVNELKEADRAVLLREIIRLKAGASATDQRCPDRRADLDIAFRRGGRSGSAFAAWAGAPMNGKPASTRRRS